MVYAQFHQRSAIDPAKIVEACGDRSVVILDGREGRAAHAYLAQTEAKKRGYAAWSLHSGPTFTRSRQISQVQPC